MSGTTLVPASLRRVLRVAAPWRADAPRRLATTTKRLDLCAAQVAHVLHLAGGFRFEGRSCVELGCGWVLTHSLVFHLLGAESVTAVDVTRQADPMAARRAVHTATASIVRDVLSPFADHERLRARLDRLLAWSDFSFAGLARLGIHYEAPVDVAQGPLGRKVDFVYSNSVLEHVPVADVDAVLTHLVADLRPDGEMLHAIHLEDHADFRSCPFAFLTIPAQSYAPLQQTLRGNRLRASAWKRRFEKLPGVDHSVLYAWKRAPELVPQPIDASIEHEGLEDLRTSHLGVRIRRAL